MKKVISVFLALMMCLSLAIPAFAVEGGTIDWGPTEPTPAPSATPSPTPSLDPDGWFDGDQGGNQEVTGGTSQGTEVPVASPKPDMCLTLPTEIVVYDDRSGNYTVGATEVRNAGKAKATITDVQVSPSQGWSLSDWDATRGNVPVNAKTFSMRVFDAAVGSTGHVADTTAFPSLQKDASADMGVSFWMAPQRDIDGRPQVADVVVTAEFEDISVYAILYDDGELVFQQGSTPEEGRTVTATYADVETATSRPWDNKASSITTVTFNCDVVPISTSYWFSFCYNLTTINGIEKLDTSKVTNMCNMFTSCSRLTSLDVTGFDTSKVTNMWGVFSGCSSLTSLDLSGWDTSSTTDMSGMFYRCRGLTSLDVSGFNTGKVTTMSSMFDYCSGLSTLDLSSFDTSNVTSMAEMFVWCSNLESLNMSGWNTSRVESMYQMFYLCSSLKSLDLSGFDTSNVTNMAYMFGSCSSLTSLDVSGFNTGNVANMRCMFHSCSNLATIYATDSFITANATNSTDMFDNCSNLVGGNGTTYSSSHVDKEYAHIDAPGTPGYFTAAPSVALLDATMDAAVLDTMAAPSLDAVTVPVEPVPELPASDGTYEVDPDTEVVEVPETPVTDPEPIPETPETPTEPSEPEDPAEVPDVPDEGPAEKPDDVPASPDVEPSQDPEPAAKPDEEDPAPDAGNQNGDGEGAPDTETPEDAQPPVDDGEAASNVPEEPGQD